MNRKPWSLGLGPILALAALAAACGEPPATGAADTTTPAPSTTTASSSTSAAASTTTPPTIFVEAPLLRDDGIPTALPVMSPDAPAGLLPAAAVPWEEVGPGWVLLTTGGGSRERDLVLLDPPDTAYGMGGWGMEWQLLDWDGGRILYMDDSRMTVLDLRTGGEDPGFVDGEPLNVPWLAGRLAGRRDTVVVGSIGLTGHDRVSVDIRSAGMGIETTLLERPVDLDGMVPSWAWHPEEDLVAMADDGALTLWDGDTTQVGALSLPGSGCLVARWWTPTSVLVACVDPVYSQSEAAECWPGSGRRLWEIPIDGSDPVPLTPPVGPGGPGCDGYEPGYSDAMGMGGRLAVVADGCCECGGEIEVVDGDGTVLGPQDDDALMTLACTPWIVAAHKGGVLVGAIDTSDGGWSVGLFSLGPNLELTSLLPEMGIGWALGYPWYGSP